MHHRMAHLHARWIAIEQQPSDLSLEHTHKLRRVAQIALCAMDRSRKMSVQTPCNVAEFACLAVMNQQRCCPKDLLFDLVIRCEIRQRHAEHCCSSRRC